MENELPPDDLKNLWQSQHVEPVQMSLEEIRLKAKKFQKRIRTRNFREYAASVVVIGCFGYYIWRFPEVRLGSAMIIAATLYMAYQLHSRGAAHAIPASSEPGTCLDFHRAELERQRDLVRDIWKWYLLPFVPGLVTFLWAPLRHLPPDQWLRPAPFALLCAGFFYLVWKLNRRAADQLQRQIDELNSMSR